MFWLLSPADARAVRPYHFAHKNHEMNGLIVGTQGSCVRYGTMVRKGGKTLPVVSENIADLFQKRCPCFKKTMGNVFQFYGQRISVPPATNFDALGNEFGASVRVCQNALVSLRALTRNLILSCESRQDGMPGQARQDTWGVHASF